MLQIALPPPTGVGGIVGLSMAGKLTVNKVRGAKPGRHGDGGGLYLEVSGTGGKSWMLRTTVHGRRRDIGLGPCWRVSLADARLEAMRLRRIAREGGDPLIERSRDHMVPTFAEVAQTVWEAKKPSWRNGRHTTEWLRSLRDYAFPHIGERRVDQITSAHVLDVLSPIWLDKAETARRVRQRMEEVFKWAKAKRFVTGDNPVEGVKQALPKQRVATSHHNALPWRETPALYQDLADREAISALALRFIILNAARSGEVRGARWSEIDLVERVWTVPADRMKAGRAHRVPLSDEAVHVLDAARGLDGNLVFPAPRGGVMSDMVFKALFKRIAKAGGTERLASLTTHGFRSSFRDWCSEEAHAPREVAEAALAHVTGDATERAYARSDLFQRRRELMKHWAQFVCPKLSNI